MHMRYPIAIEPGDNQHAFGVVVPDLPGCFSAGDSLDEAMAQARETILLHLEGMLDDAKPRRRPARWTCMRTIRISKAGFGRLSRTIQKTSPRDRDNTESHT